ncbi:MAG: polyphosphate kinase 1 [Atopobiaceae bacterium]|nr:polyphosphate kinase 1 [Atopobiaceae bacterium]
MAAKQDKREKTAKEAAAIEEEAPAEVAEQELQPAEPAEKKEPAKGTAEPDVSFTQNRELSWLRFDDRVLDEAFDERVPLFERMKFVEIFGSNLYEWFMVRVGGLTDLATLKKPPLDSRSGLTPEGQLDAIFAELPAMIARHEEAYELVGSHLAEKGLIHVRRDQLTDADLSAVAKHFNRDIMPILSPMVVDPRHPFPNLRDGHLYVACGLGATDEQGLIGVVEVPASLARVVQLPSDAKHYRYTLVEDVVVSCLTSCFGEYVPKKPAVIRVTRSADIDPDGEGVAEEADYRSHMKKVLKMRQRLQPIRLEVQGELGKKTLSVITAQLGLEPRRVFQMQMPLGLSYVYGLEDKIPASVHAELTFQPFKPQNTPMVDLSKPMRAQIEDHDVLLVYPYESMTPLLRLVREASADEACISIKITLYRVAKSSHLCESLIQAAEEGKDVTVLMELRARFDEENNIAWAERLQEAGCTVIYGAEGFKCHSKICQITYHDANGVSRITCLGTGNFNEKTARLYSDFMLMTAHPGIAADGNVFFRNLSLGNLKGSYDYLGVAPYGLKPLVMGGLDREIGRARAGLPAQVFMKMNSLTDRDVIDKIAEACEAGVRVVMIIRGICCIRANVPGRTDGLMVRQIVGRFLEHARIYAFGTEADTVYLSSADMMTRNTEHRVEIAYPVLDPTCRAMVMQYVNLQLADNVKARQLTSDGAWVPIEAPEGEEPFNSQEILLAYAYRRSRFGAAADEITAPISGAISPIPAETYEALLALPHIGSYDADSEATGMMRPIPETAVVSEPAVVEDALEPEPAAVEEAPEPVRKSRIAAAFELFGKGFRTLFSGNPQ